MTTVSPLHPRNAPMAFLSDVHGNLVALEAVLSELEFRGVKEVFVAGDLLYGGDEPLDVWRRLQRIEARCTKGLSDAALASIDPGKLTPIDEQEREKAKRFAKTRQSLGDLVVECLRRLPDSLRVPLMDGRELVMVHGSPSDPLQEMSHDMDDEEILALIGDDPADWIFCGGSHVPFRRQVGGVEVVSVGSVGAAPEGNVAHFCVFTPQMEGGHVEQCWVTY